MVVPDTLSGWLSYIERTHHQAICMGLERSVAVRDRLGVGSEAVVITVGGTNGK